MFWDAGEPGGPVLHRPFSPGIMMSEKTTSTPPSLPNVCSAAEASATRRNFRSKEPEETQVRLRPRLCENSTYPATSVTRPSLSRFGRPTASNLTSTLINGHSRLTNFR